MNKIPQPKYLNLDYFFNKFFELLSFIALKIAGLISWFGGPIFKFISIFVSVAAFAGVIILLIKIGRLSKSPVSAADLLFPQEEDIKKSVEQWARIKKHLSMENSAEWRMAVIEADSLIYDILKKAGYGGENLGELLKNVEPSDFDSLQDVWDAHKIRNKIAHEAGKFDFRIDEARAAIAKYEKALKELKYI